MSILDAVIVGIIQGLAEFLPISSSGHLVVARYLGGIRDISLSYIVLLHIGTLLAVFIALRKDIIDIIIKLLKKDKQAINLALAIIVSIIPAVFVGVFLADKIDMIFCEKGMHIMGGQLWLEPYKFVGLAFICTAYFFIKPSDQIIEARIEDNVKGKGIESVTITQGLIIGCYQAVAVIPGVSRAGATIYAGLKNGFSREFAAKFSFLMSIPVIMGAFAKDMMDAEIRTEIFYSRADLTPILVGIGVAAVVGFLAIQILIHLITVKSLKPFGSYLWIIGLICVAS